MQKRQLMLFGHTNIMEKTRRNRRNVNEAGQDRAGETIEARDRTEEDCCRSKEWKMGAEKRRQL